MFADKSDPCSKNQAGTHEKPTLQLNFLSDVTYRPSTIRYATLISME